MSAKVKVLEMGQKGEALCFCFLLLAASTFPWPNCSSRGSLHLPRSHLLLGEGSGTADYGAVFPGKFSLTRQGSQQPWEAGQPASTLLVFPPLPRDSGWWLSAEGSEKRECPDVFYQKMEEEEGQLKTWLLRMMEFCLF